MEVAFSTKKEVKKTKSCCVPKDWKTKTISEVFDFLKTKSLSRNQLVNEAINDKSIYNIHYGDIHTTYNFELLDISNIKTLPKIINNKLLISTENFLKDGDLIIADASEDYEGLCGSIELVNVGETKIISGLHTFALRDKDDNFSNGFKAYVLKNENVKKLLNKIATGISVLGVSKSNLSKVSIHLPPLPEQQKIAKILSTWDKGIESTQNLIKQLKLRKKGLMQQLLTGKKRLSGFREEWKTKPLGSYITLTLRPKPKPTNKYLALGLRSHGKGIFHKPNFDPNSIAMDTLYEVKENDLVVNITFAWEQAIAIADKKDEGGLVSHRFPTFTFNEGISDAMYFRYFVIQPRFKYLLGLISPGGAGRNRVMSKKDFPKLMVSIPSFEEQQAIANILTSADNEIKLQESNLKSLKSQKKGLMQQLLTGKTRVTVN